MTQSLYFLPIILQVLLTVLLYIALAVAKARALKEGKVDLERRALHGDAWPDNVQQINNCIRSQFEVPVLFYVLSLVLWQLQVTGLPVQALAWLFVLSRAMHAYVLTGSNVVPLRRRAFSLGTLIVVILAVIALGSL